MDPRKLRAWWFHRQGLDGSLLGRTSAEILERTGWARSVGGANPYLALHARGKLGRSQVDSELAAGKIQELPSARGCTYVLPDRHFAVGLLAGQGFGESASLSAAARSLGVTEEEIDGLADRVCAALEAGPLDPRQLKERLGDAVRNLGEEGKKKGYTTTLPSALGRLQAAGRIRRLPVGGRLDVQRYRYELWSCGPLEGQATDRREAMKALSRSYFDWIGAASLKSLRWFSGMTAKDALESIQGLGLVPLPGHEDLLATPESVEQFASFRRPDQALVALVGSLDNLSHLRLGLPDLVDPDSAAVSLPTEKGLVLAGNLSELLSHAIFDRGTLVGVWEYDPTEGRIVAKTWADCGRALPDALQETERFVRDDLGDARSFSLDSPESRKPRLAALASA